MMVRVLNRSLGHLRLEDITIETLERWREGYVAERSVSNRTVQKYQLALGSIGGPAARLAQDDAVAKIKAALPLTAASPAVDSGKR